jgi:hypothetical protein
LASLFYAGADLFIEICSAFERKELNMTNLSQGQTGPKSIAGKKISSMNALKTGLFARSAVLPFEDELQYKRHCKQVTASLAPANALEVALVQQIADSLWKGSRLELRSSLKREQVMGQLTPQQMAEFLGISGKRQARAPSYLLTPNHHFPKKELVVPKKCLQQYEHLIQHVKGVANYEAVWRPYKDLFLGLHHWLQSEDTVDLFMSGFHALNLAWQQRPRLIEEKLEEFCDLLWYQVHFEELRPQIRGWMASWYFLHARDTHAVTQIDELLIKERRHCQSLLETYFKLRKSTQEHVLFSQKYIDTPTMTIDATPVKDPLSKKQVAADKASIEANEME